MAEGGALLRRCAPKAHRGFKSHPLRQFYFSPYLVHMEPKIFARYQPIEAASNGLSMRRRCKLANAD